MGKNMIPLGSEVKDTITGYKGIVVARSEWLNGCVRVSIQAQGITRDGVPVDPVVVNQEQVQVINENPVLTEGMRTLAASAGAGAGGDRPNVTRADDIGR